MEGTSVDPTLVTTVTEEDDVETSATAQAEQAARDAAAKRRQKILQQANERMSIVEGTYSSKGNTVTDSGADGATEEAAPLTEGPTDSEIADAPAASTTSSRLAAMRRRRFKKSTGTSAPVDSAPPAEETAEETNPVVETSTITTEPADPVVPIEGETDHLPTKEPNLVKEEVQVSAPSVTVESSVEQLKESLVDPTKEEAHEGDAPKKKYMGVAKMRRRMIKERQQDAGADVATDPASSEHVEILVLPKKKRSLITTLPIAMYLLTTLLLFLAGLNIGLQQSTVNYCYSTESNAVADSNGFCSWSTVVHSELAPRTMGGVQRILQFTAGDAFSKAKKVIKPSIATPEWQDALRNEEDEFADESSRHSISEDNIDPLFGVDLDKMTEGDGIYFILARFAVRVHRWILAIFYYGPQSFFASLSSFIWSLIQFPPILFLLAISIRQVIGKAILGAKLPDKVIDESQHKDIMSTIKSFVSNLLFSSFPTAVTFYDIYTHLRSDMYVVLFGLLVGFAWSHNHQASSPFGVPSQRDAESSFIVPPQMDPEGRDEL